LWWWPGWTGFYDFVLNELFPKKKKKFKLFNELTTHWQEVHYYLLFPEIAIVSDFPKSINVNSNYSLHSEDAALEYRDTYAIYALNGIRVTKEVAALKPKDITKDMILKEPNADIRREIVRKLTAEQLVNVLEAKVLDKKHGYELLGIDLGDKRVRPYLKMKNPSLDLFHVEGCHPDTKTVEQAIMYRNKLSEFKMPEDLV
jgi:hypothetical protein